MELTLQNAAKPVGSKALKPAARWRGWASRLISFGLLLGCLLAAGPAAWAQTFVHPGIWHKLSDLDRMKYMVQAGKDPWKASYDLLRVDPKASYNYTVLGQNYTTVSRNGDHRTEFESDTRAAYQNALMWYITGDQRHANKAIQCLNAWSYLINYSFTGTPPLDAGMYTSLMVNAAEIIKNTNAGWATADINRFKAMLVYPGYSTTTVPTGNMTFYWNCYQGDSGRHGNQDNYAMKAVMMMGIFLDNRVMYDRGLRYLSNLPHRPDDLPYASGPGITGSLIGTYSYYNYYNGTNGTAIPDYIYNGSVLNYIWENGQCEESSRDQVHTMLGLGVTAEFAEIAWNQGDDLYSLGGNRILRGLEYSLRYNLTYRHTYPDQPTPWEPTAPRDFLKRFDRTGRWYSRKINPFTAEDTVTVQRGKFDENACWELPLAHYLGRMGLPFDSVRWTQRTRDAYISDVGLEQAGAGVDHPGWGGLTARRPALSPGDPVAFSSGLPQYRMNVLPGTVEAENFDYFIIGGQGKTYNDLTTTNSGGQYRTGEGVDIATSTDTGGGYHVADMQSGEWLNYTVAVPVSGNYSLAIRYAAANAGSALRFEFDGVDKTGNVTVPFGGSSSTGLTDWKSFTVAPSVALLAGVQSLRIFVTGAGNSFNLNNFSVALLAPTTPPAAPNTLAARAGYNRAVLSWDAAFSATSYAVKRATTTGGPYTTLATGIAATTYTDASVANGTTYYYVVSATNAVGEGGNSGEVAAQPSTSISLVEDNFDTSASTILSRDPEVTGLESRLFQVSGIGTPYVVSVTNGVARPTTNAAGVYDISSSSTGGSYVKPTYLNISGVFDEGTATNNATPFPARGVYFGFYPSIATGSTSFQNMRGVFINPDNGALQLWDGSSSVSAAPVQTLAYQGTWSASAQHTISYTVNTVTGNLSEFLLDGVSYQWSRTNIFTDANTMFAGFGVSASAVGQYGNILSFKVKDNLTANEVVRTPQTITFPDLMDVTVSAADFAPGATTTSGLPLTYTSSNTAVATITSGGLIHVVGVGTTTITANQAGNATYDAAPAVSKPLFVNSTTQVGGTLVEDTFTGSGLVAGRTPDLATVLGRTYALSNTVNTYSSASTVSGGQATMSTNIGATISLASGTGYTKPTEMTITATFRLNNLGNNVPTRPGRGAYLGFWSSIPTSGDSYGNMRGVFLNPDNGNLQLWNGSNSPTGTPVQTLAYAGTWSTAVAAAVHTMTYTVTTSTGAISNFTLDGTTYTWNATTIFSAANTAFAGFGVSAAAANQTGLFSYFKLASKIGQTITFNPLTTRQVGAADFAPGATTTSGLPITYTSSDPTVATITSGGLIHLVGAGTATITAAQAGDASYQAATTRTRTLTVINPITWTGTTSTAWNTAGNWNPAAVPTANDDVTIPGSAANQPTVGTAQAVHSVVLSSGATLTTTAGNTLTVNGDLTNNGGTLAGPGMVALAGPTLQTLGGSSATTFPNLTVGSAGVILSSAVSVRQLLILNGNLNTASQPFTLLSDATGTAMVVNNSTGSVVGAATVQRYINPASNAGAGYRHYSSPVVRTTVADLGTSTYTPVVNPAYNTQGNTATPFPTVFGYDESRLTAANFDQGWYSPGALSDGLTPGLGYTVNIPGTQTVDLVGTLNNGPLTMSNLTRGPQTTSGWQLLGNPYPAPINFDLLNLSNLDNAVYVFKSNGQYTGSYAAYVNGIGTNGGTNQLAIMQGFFVRTTNAGIPGSLTFSNAARLTTYANPTFNRTAGTEPLVRLSLQGTAATADQTVVYFQQGATTGVDRAYDAHKLVAAGVPLLASQVGAERLAINGLPELLTADVTVPLAIEAPTAGTYTFAAVEVLNLPVGFHAYLRDAQTGRTVDLSSQPSYSVALGAGAATGRFSLLFSRQSVLATAQSALSQQVDLFPNPAHASVTVRLSASLLSQKTVAMSLINTLGQTVLRQTLPAGTTEQKLNLAGLAQGIYTLRLETNAGIVTKRLTVE